LRPAGRAAAWSRTAAGAASTQAAIASGRRRRIACPRQGRTTTRDVGGEAAGGGVGNEREVEWRRQVEGGRALITGASPTAS
jgi:hypothetical protein